MTYLSKAELDAAEDRKKRVTRVLDIASILMLSAIMLVLTGVVGLMWGAPLVVLKVVGTGIVACIGGFIFAFLLAFGLQQGGS